MLRVDVRDLRRGPVETGEVLAADDPALAGLGLSLVAPVSVSGTLHGSANRLTFTWSGRIEAQVLGQCRRCLAPVESPVVVAVEAIFSPDPDAADDPAVYPIVEPVAAIDLTPAVREELLLAAPAFVLCREDCAGLCPRCGADLNVGPCACAAPPEPG
jgi:uncharacterized protein